MKRLAFFLAGVAVGMAAFLWWVARTMSTAEKPKGWSMSFGGEGVPETTGTFYPDTEYDGDQWVKP